MSAGCLVGSLLEASAGLLVVLADVALVDDRRVAPDRELKGLLELPAWLFANAFVG